MSQTLYAHRGTELLSTRIAENDHEIDLDQVHVNATHPAYYDGSTKNNDIYTSLSTITTGINTGQSPLQFMSAINTAHAHMGNRAFMHYVYQQYYQQAHDIAQDGFRDSPQTFPFQEQIQQAFGEQHDISDLKAYTGTTAQAANANLGSRAFHKGGHVAFVGQPTLKEAAHEAAHYVQNVRSDQLKGGIGETNDRYEQHADRVADTVTRGQSAVSLLEQMPGGSDGGAPVVDSFEAPVQMMGGNLLRRLAGLGRYGFAPMGGRLASSRPPVITPIGEGKYSYKGKELRSPGYDPLKGMVGPLPGPEGHSDFAYMQWRQDTDINPEMMTVHSAVGAVRKDAGPEKRLLVELMRNEHLASQHPADSNMPLYEGNIGGTRAPIWIKEVNTRDTQPAAMVIMPVEDVDPVIERLFNSLTPKQGPEAEQMPLWAFSSEDYTRGCTVHAERMLRGVTYMDGAVKGTLASDESSGKLRDSFMVFQELVKRGYLRYYDSPYAGERVDIWNKNIRQLFNEWYFRVTGDAPVEMLPDPSVHNAQFGATTRFDPNESLRFRHLKELYHIDESIVPGFIQYLKQQKSKQ